MAGVEKIRGYKYASGRVHETALYQNPSGNER